jgi:dimethylaniline monooxygenase (N-oxide forming)
VFISNFVIGMTIKRVLVIGGGASGLASVKECLSAGLDVVCYDQDASLGGLWRYSPSCTPDTHSSLYDSTVVHTSKEVMAFSDYPIPADWPVSLNNEDLSASFQSIPVFESILNP